MSRELSPSFTCVKHQLARTVVTTTIIAVIVTIIIIVIIFIIIVSIFIITIISLFLELLWSQAGDRLSP